MILGEEHTQSIIFRKHNCTNVKPLVFFCFILVDLVDCFSCDLLGFLSQRQCSDR